ncbi:MAG: hypothetical protein CL850_03690 [Crocinitomicaceae bacterium]|nr:hypothetical protein [Crocinitomicaceae bacterium]|tara:strand:- start:1148 stop:2026 length:879 start_codon:yes stop_codon:yes gene_type:complete
MKKIIIKILSVILKKNIIEISVMIKKIRFNIKKYSIYYRLRFINFFFNFKLSSFIKLSGAKKGDEYNDIYNTLDILINKKKVKKILEIGIGGHNLDYRGGESLLCWQGFFTNSKIYGADIIDKSFIDFKNLKTIILDQGNIEELDAVGKNFGMFDIIIDDGSHFANHQRISFNTLFKYLNDGGIYIIEDVAGSYETSLFGDPDLSIEKNNVTYFSEITHAVNSYTLLQEHKEKLNDKIDIGKIFFSKTIILIQKKIKNEKTFSRSEMERDLKNYNQNNKTIHGYEDLKSKVK